MMYGRFFLYNYTAQTFFDGKNALTTGPNPGNRDRSQTATFGDSYTFSPTKVNSFHATSTAAPTIAAPRPTCSARSDLGVNMFGNLPNYIQLTISNYFNVACGTCAPGILQRQHVPGVGRFHLDSRAAPVRFRSRRAQAAVQFDQQPAVERAITFNGSTTGRRTGGPDARAHVCNFTDGNALSDYMRQTVFAAYAQDKFKVNQQFTLNFGLRWEPELPAYDKYGRGNQFSLPAFIAGVPQPEVSDRARRGCLFDTDPQTRTARRSRSRTGWRCSPANRAGVGSDGRRQADDPHLVQHDPRFDRAVLPGALDDQPALRVVDLADKPDGARSRIRGSAIRAATRSPEVAAIFPVVGRVCRRSRRTSTPRMS